MLNAQDWNFNYATTNEAALKSLCEQVDKRFTLPTRRLYRYFAAIDDHIVDAIMRERYYRGFFARFEVMGRLPQNLSKCFFDAHSKRIFDDLIYIRASTCVDPTGCVETYAHELQHVVQHGHKPRLWAVSNILSQELKGIEPTARVIDVPSEREANIVAKRVAEDVCGADAVRRFADEQIRVMEAANESEQVARWVFFRDVSSSAEYDLLEATLPLVERYKTQIDFPMDVDKPEWWLGPL